MQIQDMKFRRWEKNGQVRIYVEWRHVQGLKNPRWEEMGYINVATGEIRNTSGNIANMLQQRGISLLDDVLSGAA